MLTKLQLEIIDKYVKEDFYDKEKDIYRNSSICIHLYVGRMCNIKVQ